MHIKSRIAIASLASFLVAATVRAQSLPTGFSDELIAGGFTLPIGLGFLPDGRMIVCEQQSHVIKVVANGVTATMGTVPGVDNGVIENERGLQHIAVDPQWPARPYIYVFFTHDSPHNCWLSMYTVTGTLTSPTSTNLTLGTKYDIITDIPDNSENHNGSSLRFGPDGFLYVSVGEDYQFCPAQDVSSGLGCIMRLDVSSLPGAGSGPPPKTQIAAAGNPIATGTGFERLVWAYGLRNPWRFHIDSLSGQLFIGDVGESTWEELDWCFAGGQNFGWPWKEANSNHGSCAGNQPPLVSPVVAHNHNTSWFSIESMVTYRNRPNGIYNFGASYDGDWFYTDYISGAVRRLQFNGLSWSAAPSVPGQPDASNWATGLSFVSDSTIGPDGAIYYLKHLAGQIRRIKSTANAPTFTVQSGAGQPVNAGQSALSPLTVRVATPGGVPFANTTVTFAVTTGGGSVSPTTVVTDSNGIASTTFTASATTVTNPIVTASTPGATSVTIPLVWRGLSVAYIPALSQITMTVRHSQTNSPVTLAADIPPPTPYLVTPYGSVWTSILSVPSTATVLDGLGLVGPPMPGFVTGPVNPTYTITFQNLPALGGVPVLLQAYALDTAILAQPQAIMISQPVTVTLN